MLGVPLKYLIPVECFSGSSYTIPKHGDSTMFAGPSEPTQKGGIAMHIHITSARCNPEMVTIEGLSPSRSRHTAKWLRKQIERAHPDFIRRNKKRMNWHCEDDGFWAAVVDELGVGAPLPRHASYNQYECWSYSRSRVRIGGRIHYVHLTGVW